MNVAFTPQAGGATLAELTADGAVVSRLRVVPYTIHVGAATLRMDGIGDVWTEKEQRNRGYARALLEAVVHRMTSGDAAISMLYGIPNFYPKFGYATAGPDYRIHLRALVEESALPAGWSARPYQASDLPAVQRLYALNTSTACGAAVRARDAEVWRHLLPDEGEPPAATPSAPPAEACRVVLDPHGAVSGYVWRYDCWPVRFIARNDPAAVVFAEAMAGDAAAAEAVLAACRGWAHEIGEARVAEGKEPAQRATLGGGPEGFIGRAALLQIATFEQIALASGGSMVRVLHVGRLLASLAPELSARVRAAGYRRHTRLTVRTELGEVTLRLSPDGLEQDASPHTSRADEETLVCELPHTALGRLALGAFPARTVLERLPSPPLEPRLLDVLELLFPQRYQHMHYPDRY